MSFRNLINMRQYTELYYSTIASVLTEVNSVLLTRSLFAVLIVIWEVMGSNPVGDPNFSLSRPCDMLNIQCFTLR